MQSTEENRFHADAGIGNRNLRKEPQKQTQIIMHSTTAPVNSCHSHHFDYSAPVGNNNNNEYLERLTRSGPKRLHVMRSIRCSQLQSAEAKCIHADAGISNKTLRKEQQKQTQIVMRSTSQHIRTTWWSGLIKACENVSCVRGRV